MDLRQGLLSTFTSKKVAKEPGNESIDSLDNVEDAYKGHKQSTDHEALDEDGDGLDIGDLEGAGVPLPLIALVMVIGYLILMVAYTMGSNGWDFTVSFYFAIQTLTTVGYGDLPIDTNAHRFFVAIMVFVGVGFIGAALGIAIGALMDLNDRYVEKMKEKEQNVKVDAAAEAAEAAEGVVEMALGAGAADSIHKKDGKDKKSMSAVEAHLEITLKRTQSIIAIGCFQIAICVIIGMVVMSEVQLDHDYFSGFYWACVTVTTVGYGDIVPDDNKMRWFTVFYMLVGCSLVAKSVGDIASYPLTLRRLEMERKILSQYGDVMTEEALDMLGNKGELSALKLRRSEEFVTRNEFILAMLVQLGKVGVEDISTCADAFSFLDKDGSGELDSKDIDVWKREKEEEIAAKKRRKAEKLRRKQELEAMTPLHRAESRVADGFRHAEHRLGQNVSHAVEGAAEYVKDHVPAHDARDEHHHEQHPPQIGHPYAGAIGTPEQRKDEEE